MTKAMLTILGGQVELVGVVVAHQVVLFETGLVQVVLATPIVATKSKQIKLKEIILLKHAHKLISGVLYKSKVVKIAVGYLFVVDLEMLF